MPRKTEVSKAQNETEPSVRKCNVEAKYLVLLAYSVTVDPP